MVWNYLPSGWSYNTITKDIVRLSNGFVNARLRILAHDDNDAVMDLLLVNV